MQLIKQRSKLTAVLLTILSLIWLPGIGQLFGGRLGRASFLLGLMFIATLCGAVGGFNYFISTIILYAVFFSIWLYLAFDSYKLNTKEIRLRWYNKWYYYILIGTFFWLFFYCLVALQASHQHFRVMRQNNSPTLQAGDIVMAKMNYGFQSGFFEVEREKIILPKHYIPLIVFSAPKYNIGSFIIFKKSNSIDDKKYIGKIISIGETTFSDKTHSIKVPKNNVLIDIGNEYEIISNKDIQGKLLYILWSTHISRIGLRLEN